MTQIKNSLNEIMDDLRGRIRNPLILSFILVWLYFHWSLIYQTLTINSGIPLDDRLNVLKGYVNKAGWFGMIGKPLLWSAISLIAYYLIAILAQAIRVLFGKRLNAFMLQKFDTGSFVLKTELNEEKSNFKRAQIQLQESENSLSRALQENDSLKASIFENDHKLKDTENKLNEVYGHINNNPQFIEKFEGLILFLFSKYKNIEPNHLRSSEFQKNYYKVLDGNWRVVTNTAFTKDNGPTLNWVVDNDNIKALDGRDFGIIKHFKYDKQYKILEFTVTQKDRKDEEITYNLILINQNEMMGFANHSFCYLKRHD